ncbi:hypothetical protein J6590_015688 [Homalodisca vitripennis]|nr:hypothetical protein J6590_015688 [Homalodisca vitripennis]
MFFFHYCSSECRADRLRFFLYYSTERARCGNTGLEREGPRAAATPVVAALAESIFASTLYIPYYSVILHCSGQQRRLSFAVAIIHNPDLLILDEPTVGLDPILSAAIWDRLLLMASNQQKTIILTTHYIEEARKADVIGLMRDGVLLAEQSPTTLMVSQGCDSLEESFLMLSQQQESSRVIQSQGMPKEHIPENHKEVRSSLFDSTTFWNSDRFIAQLIKNIKWYRKNLQTSWMAKMHFVAFPFVDNMGGEGNIVRASHGKTTVSHILAVLIFLPPAIAFIIQFQLNNNILDNLSLAVVSPELPEGQATCSTLQRTGCNSGGRPFTCRFIDFLTNSSLGIVVYDDLKEARMAARKNKVWGVLHFNEMYTDALTDRINFDLFSNNNTVVNASFIDVYMDMSNMLISTALITEMFEDVRSMIQGMLEECGLNPKIFDIPLQKMPPVYGSNNPTFLEFAIPGILCAVSFCMPVIYGIGAIMFERAIGLERSFVAGLTKFEVVSSHFVSQMVIAVLQELLMFFVFYRVYNNPHEGKMYLTFLLLLLVQLLGTFFAHVVAISHATERSAMTTGFGFVQILSIVGGIMWPVEGMHGILRNIVWAIPMLPAVEAYRAIVMRDWNISHPVVFKGFLSTSVWTVIFLVMAIVLSRRKKFAL